MLYQSVPKAFLRLLVYSLSDRFNRRSSSPPYSIKLNPITPPIAATAHCELLIDPAALVGRAVAALAETDADSCEARRTEVLEAEEAAAGASVDVGEDSTLTTVMLVEGAGPG